MKREPNLKHAIINIFLMITLPLWWYPFIIFLAIVEAVKNNGKLSGDVGSLLSGRERMFG